MSTNFLEDSIGSELGGLKEITEDPGHVKVSILGWQGSGKTFNAILLACGLHKLLGYDRPIKVFDTEKGISYQRNRIQALTGKNPVGIQAQSFQDLMRFTQACKEDDIVIIDSVTHPWQELFRAAIKAKGDGFPAIQLAKDEWSPFTKWIVGAPCHVFVCGRAGNEFDNQVNEVTGKRELVKIGSKMKVEGEFGYEPALNLEAYRWERPSDGVLEHTLLVKKDKFSMIDGQSFTFLPSKKIQEDLLYNPVFEKFEAWFKRFNFKTGSEVGLDTRDKTIDTFNSQGDGAWRREQLNRNSFLEEICNRLEHVHPGTGADPKNARKKIMLELLGTDSYEAIEKNRDGKFPAAVLKDCRDKLFVRFPINASAPVAVGAGKEK